MSESTRKHKSEAPRKLRFAVYACSTSRHQQMRAGKRVTDVSGDIVESLLTNAGHIVSVRKVISDDREMIEDGLRSVLESTDTDAAIFCGGTGISPSDITIETVSPFLEKTLPGFGEIFRRLSFDQMGSAAILSRATAGVAKGKAFFCIPGSPDAARTCVEKLILTEAGHVVKHARE